MALSIARLRAAAPLLLVAVLLVGTQLSAEAAPNAVAKPRELARFMYALSCQESGGRYDIVNPASGAYGRYQIMPFNWPNWAGRYINDRQAPQTARNQERVARPKFRDLYRWLGAWDRVAHWWLTGSSNPDRSAWSASGKRYTNNIMYMFRNGPASFCRPPVDINEGNASGPAPADPAPPEDRNVRVATGHLNLRSGPHWTENRLAWITAGTRLTVLDREKDTKDRTWYRVRVPGGRVGWVAGWFTRQA